ncbi:hypothetical protein DPMN_093960 [Dreissena polymorpha]|uniref:Uncharacterized protein n=1 Tax=Dreissena polymorpha TaxID=45954 RepID=A0A9D4L570_DREPO|nr:hypothetical protein DPMN_093960 [Dreissena polymorpha]
MDDAFPVNNVNDANSDDSGSEFSGFGPEDIPSDIEVPYKSESSESESDSDEEPSTEWTSRFSPLAVCTCTQNEN